MAARKKKAAKKAVKKRAPKRRPAARPTDRRSKTRPATLRLRGASPGFTVSDVERSLHFYQDVLGFVVADRWEQNGQLMGVEVKAGAATFYLGQDDFKKGRDRIKGVGCRIYCSTAQDIDQLAAQIKVKGGVLDHEPQTQPWGAREFGLTDPDGYKITIASAS